jgi:hypothetical protein
MFMTARVGTLQQNFNLSQQQVSEMLDRLAAGLKGVRLPYVKFPRNPNL